MGDVLRVLAEPVQWFLIAWLAVAVGRLANKHDALQHAHDETVIEQARWDTEFMRTVQDSDRDVEQRVMDRIRSAYDLTPRQTREDGEG